MTRPRGPAEPTVEELYGPWICCGCGYPHALGEACNVADRRARLAEDAYEQYRQDQIDDSSRPDPPDQPENEAKGNLGLPEKSDRPDLFLKEKPMPIPPEPNNQLCTFDTALDLATRLRDIGVEVETIYEIQSNGEKQSTEDENYVNDGLEYQYVAKIWQGPEQNIGITDAMFRTKGYNVGTFTQLATAAGKLPPEPAIMALTGVSRGVNAALTFGMR